MLTRRELLAGAGSAAAALALAGCGGAARPFDARRSTATPTSLPSMRMRKGISLIGDVNVYDDALGVRPYLLDAPQPTAFVALWLGWPTVQPSPPNPFTRAQAFVELAAPSGPAAPAFAALDAQIARANADGREVALTLYQAFPDWTRAPGSAPAPPQLAPVPDDRSPDGPWAWLVAYLCERYARDGAGNPSGAQLDWLQSMNEPNLTWWPQHSPDFPGGTIAGAVAELARSAAAVAAEVHGSPGLLLPATSDVVSTASARGTPWDRFCDELLAHLRGWEPGVPVGWAQHNYADVKLGPEADGRWRVERLLDLQRAHGWPEPSVWLTEGGYQFGVRRDGWIAPNVERWIVDPRRTSDPAHGDVYAEQVAAIERNWRAMARLPVRLWTQYQVNDRDVRFQSSLRGPVQDTPAGRVLHDPPYPVYELWSRLAT
ncbi:MAG TPA: hypothetical protein VFG31_03815 [Conexibacter sp.]|nr:hypothetical protein [Conexibacter sp.]